MSEELRHVQDGDWIRLRQTVAKTLIDLKTGQLRHPVVSISSDDFGLPGRFYLVDASSGVVTVTLPNASMGVDRMIGAKKIDASANAIVLNPQVGETVDGGPSVSTNVQWGVIWVISDGTNWFVV